LALAGLALLQGLTVQWLCHAAGAVDATVNATSRQKPPMMYQACQTHTDLTAPLRALATLSAPLLESPAQGLVAARPLALRNMAAACRLLELSAVTHRRPAWRIAAIDVAGAQQPVVEEVIVSTPFATLLRFAKPGAPAQPEMLVGADVGPLRHPAARHRADHAARP